MLFTDFFRNFFAYDLWCNRRVLAVLQEQAPADAVRLLAHVLGSQDVWLKRMTGENYPGLTPWPDLALEECAALMDAQHERWVSFLDGRDDSFFDNHISYKSFKGEEFTTSIRDILTHVNNHSTYHRAQIARALRQQDIVPPVMDYIAYARG